MEQTAFQLDGMDPAVPGERPLATRGWYSRVIELRGDGWLVASEEESALQIPSSRQDWQTLELLVRAPDYLPFEFELEVELNGVSLTATVIDPDGQQLSLPIPAGLILDGLNHVKLRSSVVLSKVDVDRGTSTWKEGVHLYSAALTNDLACEPEFDQASQRAVRLSIDEERTVGSITYGSGRSLQVRVPAPGKLHLELGDGPALLLIQDAASGAVLERVELEGKNVIDLAAQVESEVSLTIWPQSVEGTQLKSLWFETTAPLPGLVIIVVDTLRFDAVSSELTPAIASLGNDGISFDHSFSHAPMTLPSHTALFSSQYPHSTGIVNNGQVVPEQLLLLPEWLGSCGYKTLATASLATLWKFRAKRSLDQGFGDFRHVQRDYSHGPDTARLLEQQLNQAGYGVRDDSPSPGDSPPANPQSPLFLFAHLADPHEPYRLFEERQETLSVSLNGEQLAREDPRTAPHIRATFQLGAGEHELEFMSSAEEFVMRSLYLNQIQSGRSHPIAVQYVEGERLATLSKVRARFTLKQPGEVSLESWVCDRPAQAQTRARYRSEVAIADSAVGQILDSLKARGLYDSSLILFTSDHGEAFGEHQLNGHSQNLYDELLHVPLIIKPPTGVSYNHVRAQLQRRSNDLIRHIDLAPTLLAIQGLPPLPDAVGDSLLHSPSTPKRLFAETHKPESPTDQYCVRNQDFKLIYYPASNSFELFDLAMDPYELSNVFGTEAVQQREWQDELERIAREWEAVQLGELGSVDTTGIEVLGY